MFLQFSKISPRAILAIVFFLLIISPVAGLPDNWMFWHDATPEFIQDEIDRRGGIDSLMVREPRAWDNMISDAIRAKNYNIVPWLVEEWQNSDTAPLRPSTLVNARHLPLETFRSLLLSWHDSLNAYKSESQTAQGNKKVKPFETTPLMVQKHKEDLLFGLARETDFDVAILQTVLDLGVNVNEQDNEGDTALFLLYENHHPQRSEAFQLFLDHGYDLSLKTKNGSSFLGYLLLYEESTLEDYERYKAAEGDHKDLIWALQTGWAVLMNSWYSKLYSIPDHPIHQALEDYFNDPGVNALIDDRTYPFMFWVAIKEEEWFRRFQEAGADYDLTDSQGNTVLHKAAFWGNRDVFAWEPKLLDHLNLQNNQGQSPLHIAIEKERFAMGLDLIQRGTYIDLLDSSGLIAFDYFDQMKRDKAEETLESLKGSANIYYEYLELPQFRDTISRIELVKEEEKRLEKSEDMIEGIVFGLVLPSTYLLVNVLHREQGGGVHQTSTIFSHASAGITMTMSTFLLTYGLSSSELGSSRESSGSSYGYRLIGGALALVASGLTGIISTAALGDEFNNNPVLYYSGPAIISVGGLLAFISSL
jgi:ankyrin repeat protein